MRNETESEQENLTPAQLKVLKSIIQTFRLRLSSLSASYTLQNWEQGNRRLEGTARALLRDAQ